MSRSGFARLLILSVLAFPCSAVPGRAQPAPAVCVYASRSYSNGAILCVQKSLALVCQSDGLRATWAVDSDVSDRCVTSAAYPHARLRLQARGPRRHHVIDSTRCFDFAGKHYCE